MTGEVVIRIGDTVSVEAPPEMGDAPLLAAQAAIQVLEDCGFRGKTPVGRFVKVDRTGTLSWIEPNGHVLMQFRKLEDGTLERISDG